MLYFSFKAHRVIEDTFNAIDQADEIDGLELEEYARVMEYISEELHCRANNAINQLLMES
jgi:hypothetical protein